MIVRVVKDEDVRESETAKIKKAERMNARVNERVND